MSATVFTMKDTKNMKEVLLRPCRSPKPQRGGLIVAHGQRSAALGRHKKTDSALKVHLNINNAGSTAKAPRRRGTHLLPTDHTEKHGNGRRFAKSFPDRTDAELRRKKAQNAQDGWVKYWG